MTTLNKIQVLAASESMIGPIDVSGMSKKETIKEVRSVVEIWQGKDIAIQVGEAEVSISGEAFNFDVNRSVERLKNAQKIPWYNFWSTKPEVKSELIVHATTQLRGAIAPLLRTNVDEAIDSLLQQAAELPIRPLKIAQNNFELADGQILTTITLPIVATEMNEMTKLANSLDELVFEPYDEFSFFNTLGRAYKIKNANVAATALYNNALQAGFDISQRHAASRVQSYVEAGFEATINRKKSYDLVFKSTRNGLVKLSAKVKNNEFVLAFYVPKNEELPNIVLYTADKKTIEPRIIYRYSEDLILGDSKEIQSSKEGLSISIYRKITTLENDTEKKLISANYYAPTHQIVLKAMEESNVDETVLNKESAVTEDSNAILGDGLTDIVDKGILENEEEQLIDRNKLVIEKVENPTEEQLASENLVYSESDDSYYYVHAVDAKAEGEK